MKPQGFQPAPLLRALAMLGVLVSLVGCGNGSQPTAPSGSGTIEGTLFIPAGSVSGAGRTASDAIVAPNGLTPLAGATVTLSDSPQFVMVTGPDGHFGFGGVPRGDHTLFVTRTGYQDQNIVVSVKSGQTTQIGSGTNGLRMVPATSGTLVVLAQTPGGVQLQGQVTLNGVATKMTTPYTMTGIPTGQHTISVSLPGYIDEGQKIVHLSQGQVLNTSFILTPQVNQKPTVSILVPVNNQTLVRGVSMLLVGSSVDPEDGVLSGSSLVWSSSIDGVLGTGVSLNVNQFSLGHHVITLTATDLAGGTETATANLDVVVAPNNPPSATIVTPLDGTSVLEGAAVTLNGTGADVEDGVLTGSKLVWTSDLQGALGTGSPLVLNTLQIGTHTITLTTTDSKDATGKDTVVVSVRSPQNQNPVAAILTPLTNQQFASGAAINFTGTGLDPEEGQLTGSRIVWSSNRDGQLGVGSPLSLNNLSLGAHTITLTVTDSNGGSGTATRNITVAQTANTPPTATILTPADGGSFTSGSTITFTGTGVDTEDGVLTGDRLVWSSSKDGTLGTGTALQKTNLSVGVHTITLTVVDTGGLSGIATRSLTVTVVLNTAPTANILTPPDGQEIATGGIVVLTGAGVDDQEGNLDGSRLSWTSSKDGALGTGNNLIKTNLSTGTHIITLTVTDNEGLHGTDTTTINISSNPNNAPVATIVLPGNNQAADRGTPVLFVGTGADVEDGVLTGANLIWTSSIDGQIGTGNQFSVATLSAGTHTITLKATDSADKIGTTTRTLVINPPLSGVGPQVTIVNPANNAQVTAGSAVLFSGTGVDPQDGALTGTKLVWTSSIQGQLGTGGALFVNNLQAGTHTITLTAKDSDNNTGTATRTLIVNPAP